MFYVRVCVYVCSWIVYLDCVLVKGLLVIDVFLVFRSYLKVILFVWCFTLGVLGIESCSCWLLSVWRMVLYYYIIIYYTYTHIIISYLILYSSFLLLIPNPPFPVFPNLLSFPSLIQIYHLLSHASRSLNHPSIVLPFSPILQSHSWIIRSLHSFYLSFIFWCFDPACFIGVDGWGVMCL